MLIASNMYYNRLSCDIIISTLIVIISYTIAHAHNVVSDKVTSSKKIIYQIKLNKLHAIESIKSQGTKRLQFLKWLNSPITRDNVILNCLPFTVGDRITEEALTEAKNILCKTSYFKKVAIRTQAIEEESDLLIVTISTTDSFRIDGDIFKPMIRYSNLFGRGHVVYNHFFFPIISGYLGYGIRYEIPTHRNIFTMALQGYFKDGAENRYKIRYGDVWIRKDFAIGLWEKMQSRTFFTSAKYICKYFKKRPPLVKQYNKLYQNYHFFIGSIGIKNERYYECEQVFKQLGKDEIPFGSIVTTTAGYQIGEFVNRWYIAVDLSKGRRINYVGHLYGQITIGGFLRQKEIEQGTLKLQIGYFTPLLKTRSYRFRSFINMTYITGYNRLVGELLGINEVKESEEIDDKPTPGNPYSYLQKGTSRISAHYRNLFFVPMILRSVKIAFLFYVDLVALQDPKNNKFLFRNSICKEFGLGLQLERKKFLFLHDLNLVIKTGYCPMIHMPAPIQLSLNINLLPAFKRKAPDIIAYY